MPLSTDVYQGAGQQSLAGGLAGALNQFTEQRARLSDLARQREQQDITQGYQNRALQRAEEAIPAQQAALKQEQLRKQAAQLQAFTIGQVRRGASGDELTNNVYTYADTIGVPRDKALQGISPLLSGKIDAETYANELEAELYPEVFAKQRAEAQFRKPEKVDEGTPVELMKDGKRIKEMSKSGRYLGEAPPPSALVNIGNLGQPFELTKNGEKKLVQMDKKGKIVEVPGGYGPKEGKEKSLTEGQAKATTFASQMAAASNELDALEAKGFDPTKASTQFETGIAGGIGNVFTSAQAQQAKQTQNQWSEAFLRVKTGAAATLPEVELNNKTFFPQVGDTKDVIEQKRRMRIQAERDTLNMAGPGREMATQRINTKQGTSQDSEAIAWANANPNDPRAIAILKANAR